MKRFFVVAMLLASTAAVQAQSYKEVWDDVRKPWRPNSEMNADLQADVQVCDRKVGEQLWGKVSPAYRRCMARHHWRLSHVERLPRVQRLPDEPEQSSPIPDTSPTPSEATPPDTTPVPPIVLDPVPSPDIHPFCADTVC
jgi:hypothetical protein